MFMSSVVIQNFRRTPRGIQSRRCFASPSSSTSLLPLIRSSNNVHLPLEPFTVSESPRRATSKDGSAPKHEEEFLLPFLLRTPLPTAPAASPLGLLRPSVTKALLEDHNWQLQDRGRSPWSFHPNSASSASSVDHIRAVSFSPHVKDKCARTEAILQLVNKWSEAGQFKDILGGWSNEECPVYIPSVDKAMNDGETLAFTIERAALPLFGFPNFGTFLIGYFTCERTRQLMIWVPRRSYTKKTFPGLLDVTAGGGMALGEPPLSSVIREAAEEASLHPDYVSKHIRTVGRVTFSNRSPSGWLLPGLYYTYDLPLPADLSIRPQTNSEDGEVNHFELLSAQECLEKLAAREFKPSSALAIVDFLSRHGVYTPQNDETHGAVMTALRGDLVLPIPFS